MFKSKTVFVIGAGASTEIGLPLGEKLLSEISQRLDIQYDYRLVKGDYRIDQVLRQIAGQGGNGNERLKALQKACWRIRDAAKQAESIDNVIDQHEREDDISVCGKLAIVLEILTAESKSNLRLKDWRDELDLSSLRDTWFHRLGRILAADFAKSSIEGIFQNCSFITFNYDRSLEHFLPYSLHSSYGIGLDHARKIVDSATIIHPYGAIGKLPWQTRAGAPVRYGEIEQIDLMELAKSIRTFSESMADAEEIERIRDIISSCYKVVFLGFAFHPANMKILLPKSDRSIRRIIATAFGMSEDDRRIIQDELQSWMQYPELSGVTVENRETTCTRLFREYTRSIAA